MAQATPRPPTPSGSFATCKSRLQILGYHLRQPLQIGLATSLLAAIVSITLPNQYKSETRILPADGRSTGGGAVAAAAAMGVNIPGQESPDAVLVDILNSRSLREALLNVHFNFKVRTWYFGKEQTRNQTLFDYLGKKNIDRAVKALKGRITVTRDIKTKLITLTVETESPELSQQMAQRLVSLLDEFVVTKSQTRGGVKATFSEKRLFEARMEMTRAEESFRIFLDNNRNYLASPDPAVRLKGNGLDNELKLRTQLVSTLAIAREQALLEEKNDMPILNVLDVGNLPFEKSGPSRASIVGISLFLGTILSFSFVNRVLLRKLLATYRGETA